LLSRSRTKIESRQNQRKLFAFKPDFVTPPILTTLVETFQPSLLGYAALPAGPVVATDAVSANADYDNGRSYLYSTYE
jgi:hypothetical protein